jgi:predicted dehydrogenase
MMRAALIGCGFFAQNHVNAWRGGEAETSGLDNLKTFALAEAAYAGAGRAVPPLEARQG